MYPVNRLCLTPMKWKIYWMTMLDVIKQDNYREWTQLYLENADTLRKKIQKIG